MDLLVNILYRILFSFYMLFSNYGIAIIVFTLFVKVVILPVSIWVQKNSIKIVRLQPDLNELKIKYFGDKDGFFDAKSALYKREKYNQFASLFMTFLQLLLLIIAIAVIKKGLFDTGIGYEFFGLSLDRIPIEIGGGYYTIPIFAALSTFLMSMVQNKENVIQDNSSDFMKYSTTTLSVLLSLYLGLYVSVAVVLYWIVSNLLSIVQIYLLNMIYKPQNFIDYQRLEESRKKLESLKSVKDTKKMSKEDRKREKQDYKRFFNIENKKLVIYSEESGYYKYFQGIIEYILDNTNIVIHYITSDPKDKIFDLEKNNQQIQAYYIGHIKLITLMMKIEADIVFMTMPDLNNYHIKKSYLRKDIEYIFIPHAPVSINLTMRKGCIDHYDTIFISGKHQLEEIRKSELVYNQDAKNLIRCGYPLLDKMIEDYIPKQNEVKTILIAPSWHEDNLMDLCIEDVLDSLKASEYHIIVRAHPQYLRHKSSKMELLKKKYASYTDITIEDDFSSNSTVFDADIVISDWSGIALEFAFTTHKPVLFVDTPMKVMNPDYRKIDVEPINIWIRNEIGKVIAVDETNQTLKYVEELFESHLEYNETISRLAIEYIYNIGSSSEVAGKYIIGVIKEKIADRRKQK